jgi:hypothetical protein
MSESRSGKLFKCPKCGAAKGSDVCDSRGTEKYIRRRRKCNSCGFKFTTRESVLTDELDDPDTISRQALLNLRALAIDIIRKTDCVDPKKNPEAIVPPGRVTV